jgi:hypothetical protein
MQFRVILSILNVGEIQQRTVPCTMAKAQMILEERQPLNEQYTVKALKPRFPWCCAIVIPSVIPYSVILIKGAWCVLFVALQSKIPLNNAHLPIFRVCTLTNPSSLLFFSLLQSIVTILKRALFLLRIYNFASSLTQSFCTIIIFSSLL